MLVSALVAYRSTGSTVFVPRFLGYLAWAYAELGQFADAQGCTVEAITTTEITKESWNQADIHCIAGDIALRLPDRGATKAETHFRACAHDRARAAGKVLGTARGDEHGAIRASRNRPTMFLPRSMAGSLRASTRPTSKKRRPCSTSSRDPPLA